MNQMNGKSNVTDIQHDIERTREDLAETVDQFTAKMDVKGRVKDRAEDAKVKAAATVNSVREDDRAKTGAAATVAVAVTTAAVVWWWRRRNARRRSGWWS